MVVQIHQFILFLFLYVFVYVHRIFLVQIVLGLWSPLDKILERMLTQAPHILWIKVLGDTEK